MDARQDEFSNPFGMDEQCTNCPDLCETRSTIVHGYGDVGADFVVVGESPSAGADETGIPFTGDDELVYEILAAVGFAKHEPAAEEFDRTEPTVGNVFLTGLTRCHHPERGPTDSEVDSCDAYLSSELRMINPEIIVPVGQRTLEALAFEYTTERAEDLDVEELHATTLRGRGFELIPMLAPDEQSADDTEAFVSHLAEVVGTDYRQTKGRRGSLESGRGPDKD
jgi:uracil-DNA glycosylase family 4